jgi:uncharacterized membrane protein required for colicin V production
VRLDNLVINLFDVLLIAVLGVGMAQGRKRGMSEELMPLLKWLVILFGCAAVYPLLGGWIAQSGAIRPATACLMVYLGTILLIFLGFSTAERRLKGKLVGSDYFGGSEYYLGMASGAVRASCMLLVALALLNARTFTPAEVNAIAAYQDAAYGSQVFPTLHSTQVAVFERSLTGPWIKQNLGFLLINAGQPQQLAQKR